MGVKREAVWVFSSTGVAAVSQFTVYALLARSGTPEVLGWLAIVNVVLMLIFLLQEMGLSNYFIHRQDLDRKEQSTLFAMNVMAGFTAALMLILLAHPIGSFYDAPMVTSGLMLVSVNFIFIGMSSQYQAQFIKTFRSHDLAKIEILSRLMMLAISVYFIFWCDLSLIGYFYAVLISSLIKLCMIVCVAPKEWHPSWCFEWGIVRPAASYGGYQLAAQFINQLRTQFDQLIIGKWLGIESLGIYALAKELVMQPLKITSPLVSRLVLPRLASLQSDASAFSALFEKASRMVLTLNALIYVLVSLGVIYILPVIFGSDYSEVVDIFAILLLVGLLRPTGILFGAIVNAQGNSKIEFKWCCLSGGGSLFMLGLALPFESISAFAGAMVVSQLLLSCYAARFFAATLIHVNASKYFRSVAVLTIGYLVFTALDW